MCPKLVRTTPLRSAPLNGPADHVKGLHANFLISWEAPLIMQYLLQHIQSFLEMYISIRRCAKVVPWDVATALHKILLKTLKTATYILLTMSNMFNVPT